MKQAVTIKASILIIAAIICSCLGTCACHTSLNPKMTLARMPASQMDTNIDYLAEQESGFILVSSVRVSENNECYVSTSARVYKFPFDSNTPASQFIKIKRNKGFNITILKNHRWASEHLPGYGSWKPVNSIVILEKENW